MARESYRVRLEKETFLFSAAHFITFNGNICERLHGHNYRVYAEVDGPLDENKYVIDFIALRDTLKSITDQMDHRMLLPTRHPMIQLTETETEVEATFEDRRWIFPREDCLLLPVENTTAELLARHICHLLLEQLTAKGISGFPAIEVGVDENEGQWAIYRHDSSAT